MPPSDLEKIPVCVLNPKLDLKFLPQVNKYAKKLGSFLGSTFPWTLSLFPHPSKDSTQWNSWAPLFIEFSENLLSLMNSLYDTFEMKQLMIFQQLNRLWDNSHHCHSTSMFLSNMIEKTCTDVARQNGTKRAPKTLREIVFTTECQKFFGPDCTLILIALFATPFGFNIRNLLWHGFLPTNISLPKPLLWFLYLFSNYLTTLSPFNPTTLSTQWIPTVSNLQVDENKFFKTFDLFYDKQCEFSTYLDRKEPFNLQTIIHLMLNSSIILNNSPLPKNSPKSWFTFIDFSSFPSDIQNSFLFALECYQRSINNPQDCTWTSFYIVGILLATIERFLRFIYVKSNHLNPQYLQPSFSDYYTTLDVFLSASRLIEVMKSSKGMQNQSRINNLPSLIGNGNFLALQDILVRYRGPELRLNFAHYRTHPSSLKICIIDKTYHCFVVEYLLLLIYSIEMFLYQRSPSSNSPLLKRAVSFFTSYHYYQKEHKGGIVSLSSLLLYDMSSFLKAIHPNSKLFTKPKHLFLINPNNNDFSNLAELYHNITIKRDLNQLDKTGDPRNAGNQIHLYISKILVSHFSQFSNSKSFRSSNSSVVSISLDLICKLSSIVDFVCKESFTFLVPAPFNRPFRLWDFERLLLKRFTHLMSEMVHTLSYFNLQCISHSSLENIPNAIHVVDMALLGHTLLQWSLSLYFSFLNICWPNDGVLPKASKKPKQKKPFAKSRIIQLFDSLIQFFQRARSQTQSLVPYFVKAVYYILLFIELIHKLQNKPPMTIFNKIFHQPSLIASTTYV